MDLDLSNTILHRYLDAVAGLIDWERAAFFRNSGLDGLDLVIFEMSKS